MKIAIIGSGISGLVTAYHLIQTHEATLFEANDYIGGHTHTHSLHFGDSITRWTVDLSYSTIGPIPISLGC